jgi:hypothetical protein
MEAIYLFSTGGSSLPDIIDDVFQDFTKHLVLPGEHLQQTLGKSRQVSDWSRRKLKSSGSFLGGTYRRGTDMPDDSLKMHLLLSRRYFYDCAENSTKLLFFLKNMLSEDYCNPVIDCGGTVIRLKSTPAPDLDLIPTIRLSKGGYLVPNGYGGWCKSNAAREETIFKKKDEVSRGRFLRLAKIIKAWNIMAGLLFDVYFLELMVYYRVNDFSKHYPDLVYSLYVSMRLFMPEFLNCPAAGEVISSGVGSVVRQLQLQDAESIAAKAFEETDQGKALKIWQKLLGEDFGRGYPLLI